MDSTVVLDMAKDGDRQDPMVTKLIMDMKALAILHPSDADLRSTVGQRVLGSHDEQVNRVIDSMVAGKPQRNNNNVIVALGELLFASFLMVSGIIMIAPFLVGVPTPNSILDYFSSSLGQLATASSVFPILPELVVVLAVLLLMSAVYALRKASFTLKEEGYLSR